MLLAGFELTKEYRESQLYNEFKRFKMIPGENITDYYVRFHKLVNDMRNIKMTMSNIQLNSKFVNNMTPEWDRFVTAVKLNKGLKETNHEQLYEYLKQHEKHAAYDHLINDRFNPTTNDPLALVSHVQPHTQISHVQSYQLLQGKDSFDASSREWCRVGRRRVVVSCRRTSKHADDYDAFDSDVDDEPTTQTIFMANLSSTVSSLQQVGRSNASILSEVLNLENAIDHHEIPNEVQQTNVLDSDSVDMGNSNVIPYEQYVKHNEESVVPSAASSVQYDDYMLHENSAYVPDDSFTTTLNIYKDQVAIYEQRAKFELTDREQKMDDQMRMLI
nr:UBN2 domain-containing protein [Tanacetum cinerariifolium]